LVAQEFFEMLTKEQIIAQLKMIVDPELNVNIVDLGLIYDIAIAQDTGEVEITMTLTSPGCPLSYVFEEWIPDAVKKISGVQEVRIKLVWEPAWNPDKMTDDAKELLGIIS
jgi:metal-sulfur cluster biosynthetic enzyme